jgi:hypothetical protein
LLSTDYQTNVGVSVFAFGGHPLEELEGLEAKLHARSLFYCPYR